MPMYIAHTLSSNINARQTKKHGTQINVLHHLKLFAGHTFNITVFTENLMYSYILMCSVYIFLRVPSNHEK